MEKDKSVIPKGIYCYGKNGLCPYWSCRKDKLEQENGYCSYIEKGDWEINDEAVMEDMKTGETARARDIGLNVGLLWDQCKECDVDTEIDEEDIVTLHTGGDNDGDN